MPPVFLTDITRTAAMSQLPEANENKKLNQTSAAHQNNLF